MNIPKRIDRKANFAACDRITAEFRDYQRTQDKAAIQFDNVHDYLDDVRRTRGKSYECEMVVEHAGREALAKMLYELADRGHDLRHSATFQILLEKAAAEDLGL